jgi:hypothetical protein
MKLDASIWMPFHFQVGAPLASSERILSRLDEQAGAQQ